MNAVGAEVERALGVKPERIELIPTDEWNEVYRVETAEGSVIFKTHDEYNVAVESWAYRRAAEAGVPVPQVLASDITGTTYPAPYFIVREAPGRALDSLSLSPSDARPALLDIGESLRALHEVRMEGFGFFDVDVYKRTGLMRGRRSSESELIAENNWALPYILEHELIEASTVERIAAAQARAASAFASARGVVLHTDVGSDHIWVDPSTMRVTAIIDFGDARAGDRAWEFAPLAIHEPSLFPVVLEGYGPDDPAEIESKLDVLTLIRLCGELRWMHERDLDCYDWPARIRAALAKLEARL